MSNTKVTVGIVGNPNASAGIQSLLNIDSPFNLRQDKQFYPEIGGNYYIELVHTPEYISYQYVSRPSLVHSYQASRPGSLWIALTVPRGKRFSFGISPYRVLMEILELFRQTYMTPRMDGSYEFKTGSYFSAPFYNLLDKYPLEPDFGRYIEMKGTSPVPFRPLTEEQMTQFFLDTQYEEFQQVGSIIVADSVSWGSLLELPVPRPLNFSIYSSGQLLGMIHSTDEIFSRILRPDDDFHKEVEVRFSLSELRKNIPNVAAKFALNEQAMRIDISPVFPEKYFRVKLIVQAPEKTSNEVHYDEQRFYLVDAADNTKIKPLKKDGGDFYFEFVGQEANVRWKVCYEASPEAMNFQFNVRPWQVKEPAPVIKIDLQPFAEFQGVEYRIFPYLKEPAFLELKLGAGEVFRIPIVENGSGNKPLHFIKKTDIKEIRIVSEHYIYPHPVINYNPSSGWLSIRLNEEPAKINRSDQGPSFGGLEIFTQLKMPISAVAILCYKDGMKLQMPVQLSEEEKTILPCPFQSGLVKVRFAGIRDDRRRSYYDRIISLEELSQNSYKIYLDELHKVSILRRVLSFFKKTLSLFVCAIMCLILGLGLGFFASRSIVPDPDKQAMREELDKLKTQNSQLRNTCDSLNKLLLPRGKNSTSSSQSQVYTLSEKDKQQSEQYYKMMTVIEEETPLSFDQVDTILEWRNKIKKGAKRNTIDSKNFSFIDKYIDYFAEAAGEIKNAQHGDYHRKNQAEAFKEWNKKFTEINMKCGGNERKAELTSFRECIQRLYLFETKDPAKKDKETHIRRVVLSGVNDDKKLLENVSSFYDIPKPPKNSNNN